MAMAVCNFILERAVPTPEAPVNSDLEILDLIIERTGQQASVCLELNHAVRHIKLQSKTTNTIPMLKIRIYSTLQAGVHSRRKRRTSVKPNCMLSSKHGAAEAELDIGAA
jgi:hypothetical protein